MKLAAIITALCVLMSPAVAAATEVLYEKKPWAVARVDDLGLTTCQARILVDGRHLFQVVAISDLAFIGVAAQDWTFAKHTGSLTLKVGISAAQLDGALYDGQFIRVTAKVEAIHGIMLMLNRSGDLEVMGEGNELLATFPFEGMVEALQVWRTCADDLPKE